MENKREPIKLERQPIMLTRQAIFLKRVPMVRTFDDVYKVMEKYIYKAAWETLRKVNAGETKSNITLDELIQEGRVLLFDCYTRYKNKPSQEFYKLFKSSLWRQLKKNAKENTKEFLYVDEYTANAGSEGFLESFEDEVLDNLYEEQKLKQVVELLAGYPLAVCILKEFLNPSTEVRELAVEDYKGRKKPRTKSVEITSDHIRECLGLTRQVYEQQLLKLREVIYCVYTSEGTEIKQYFSHVTLEELQQNVG